MTPPRRPRRTDRGAIIPRRLAGAPGPAEGRAARVAFWAFVLHLWTVFGIALSNLFYGVAALLTPWVAPSETREWSRFSTQLLPLLVYALALAGSIVFSVDPSGSLRGGRETLTLAVVPLALLLVRGERAVRLIADGLVVLGALLAIHGLAQLVAGPVGLDNRIRGPFSHYMTFAGVLLLADLVLLARLFGRPGPREGWRWGALLLINVALVAGLTRSAWVALGLSLTALLLLRAPRWIAAYLPAALLFFTLAPVQVVQRVVSIGDLRDDSNYDRLCMVDAGMRMMAHRPLFGIGPLMVRNRYPIYRHPTAPRAWVPHLHNNAIQIGAEKGVLALGAYLWLMVGALVTAYRGYRRESGAGGTAADLYLAAFLGLLGFNVAGIFEYNWGDSEVQRLALFLVAVPACLAGGSGRDG